MSQLDISPVLEKTFVEAIKLWGELFEALAKEIRERLNIQSIFFGEEALKTVVARSGKDNIDSMRALLKETLHGNTPESFNNTLNSLFEHSANNIINAKEIGFNKKEAILEPLQKGFTAENIRFERGAQASLNTMDFNRFLMAKDIINTTTEKILSENLAAYRKSMAEKARENGIKGFNPNSINFTPEEVAGILCGPDKEKIFIETIKALKDRGVLPLHEIISGKKNGNARSGQIDIGYLITNDSDSGLFRKISECLGMVSGQKVIEARYYDSFEKLNKDDKYIENIKYIQNIKAIREKMTDFLNKTGVKPGDLEFEKMTSNFFTKEEINFITEKNADIGNPNIDKEFTKKEIDKFKASLEKIDAVLKHYGQFQQEKIEEIERRSSERKTSFDRDR